MKKRKFKVGDKILLGFFILILIFSVNAVVTIFTLQNGNSKIAENSEVIKPSESSIETFITMVIRSKMFTTNWVYLQRNNEDKEELVGIHETEFPELKDKITQLVGSWSDSSQVKLMDSAFTEFEGLLAIQQSIMEQLQSFDDYEDPFVRFTTEDILESQVLPASNQVIEILNEIKKAKSQEATDAEQELIASFQNLGSINLLLAIITVVVGLLCAFLLARIITRPIVYVKDIISQLGRGELPEMSNQKRSNDEIGEMTRAVESLANGLKETSLFAEKIGNGKYEASFDPLSENDVLGNALLEMRDNLKKVADEDKKRNWTTEGLAKFGEILRSNNDNFEQLCDDIISELIKYLKANQGGIYIINEEDDDEAFLYLAACYAWDKKKYLDQKIYQGEGLVGQVWFEKESVFLTEVPDNYITITSGLGDASPRCILIVPLKVNEEIHGVIEIASFQVFTDYERDFVEKIAESIASTISSAKINTRTQKLLEESQELTEQMRSQEEEMRQNMEELQATQEEMMRSQKDKEEREYIINNTQMVIELDENLHVLSMNSQASKDLGFTTSELKGKRFSSIMVEPKAFESIIDRIKKGDAYSGKIVANKKDKAAVELHISAGKTTDMEENKNKFLIYASLL